jgi:hypothetical protein
LFFVIVAVGLALSWGQVGRKAQRTLEETPVVFLATEPDCRARQVPCAAIGADRALVLGPDAGGVRIRQTGLAIASIVRAEVSFLAVDGSELGGRRLPSDPQGWRLVDIPADARGLHVRVVSSSETTAAEFAL